MKDNFDLVYFNYENDNQLTPDEIKQAENGLIPYYVKDKKYNWGVAEIQGKRDSQEDRVDFAELPGFHKLDAAQQEEVIRTTIKTLCSSINADPSLYGGSCLLTTIICPIFNKKKEVVSYEIISVNLGDSEAILISLNKTGNFEFDLLNTLHKRSNSNRVAGMLAVDHAIGDEDFIAAGLSQEPEIKRYSVDVDNKKEAHLLVCCDGLRERSQLLDEIPAAIKNISDPGLLAKELVQAAFKSKSRDNISAFIIPISNRERAIKVPLALSVYDGHGGELVAEYARSNFLRLLADNIALKKNSSKVKVSDKQPSLFQHHSNTQSLDAKKVNIGNTEITINKARV